MGFKWTDGFDSYDGGADLGKKWTAPSGFTWHATAGKNGGGALQAVSQTGGSVWAKPGCFGASGFTGRVGWGFWVKISSAPAAIAQLIVAWASDFSFPWRLMVNTNGTLAQVRQDGAVSFNGVTSVCDDAYHWVEWIPLFGSSGNTKCHVDGVQQWDGTANPGGVNGGAYTFTIGTITGRTITVDDVVAYIDSGSAPTLSSYPLGSRQISTLRPTSDSAVQFSRSTGSDNYALVDEVDGDVADYVQSNTSGHQDLYGFGNLGFTPSTVNGVMLNAYMHNPGAGSINAKLIGKNGSTQVDGAAFVVPPSARVEQLPFDVDPDGGGAWSGSAVDSALFGVKVA